MPEARLRRSAGAVSSVGLHLVWCPKYRHCLLGGRVARRLNTVLDQVATEIGWHIVAREVMAGHVHIFVRVRTKGSPAEVVRRFKGRSSRVLRAEPPWPGRRKVLWPKPYFAASVGYVPGPTVPRYIEHHWDKERAA